MVYLPEQCMRPCWQGRNEVQYVDYNYNDPIFIHFL